MIPLKKKLPKPEWYVENVPGGIPGQRKRLWKEVVKYTGHPLLIDWTARLIKKYKVPERNDAALVRAVQKYSQDYIKFFREKPERFASPMRTIVWGIGDCDDKSLFIAAVLRGFRIPIRLKFIRFSVIKDGIKKKVSHVYPQAKILWNGIVQWVSLESVHPWPMGEDPEDRARAKGIKVEVNTIGDK